MNSVNGIKIEINDLANIPLSNKKNQEKKMSDIERTLFRKEIMRLHEKGVIQPISDTDQGFVSSIFLRQKKNNKYRLILNLKSLNKNIVYRHFKMDTLQTALGMINPNYFMASIDLSDAYYSIPVAPIDQKFLLFQFEGIRYRYTCLPNGLSSAPRIFTKIMKPVLSSLRKKGHQVMNYLDDLFMTGESVEECQETVLETVKLLSDLGFTIHPDKSQFTPSQVIEFLGFIINTKSFDVKLTPEKVLKINSNISSLISNKRKTSIREVAQILGSFEASLPAIPHGRLHMFYLSKAKNAALKISKGDYEGGLCLDENCIAELNWWSEHLGCSKPIRQTLPKIVIYSDACPNGWGAAFENKSTGGHWSLSESENHINILELKAAIFALKIYATQFFNTTVHLKVDNTSTLAWINKQTGPNIVIFNLVKEFWDFCIDRNLWVFASYIKSKRNKTADKESRALRENLEWTLKKQYFDKLVNIFGKFTIDLFASRMNRQVNRYFTYTVDSDALGVDAFSQKWLGEHFYAFPPFSVIPKTLQKIEEEGATGLLVVPLFTTQAWFTKLLRLLVAQPVIIGSCNNCLYFPFRTKKEPNRPNANLIACMVSGNSVLTKQFQRTLPQLSSLPGGGGTKDKYATYEKRWREFCHIQKVDFMQPSVNDVLLFLHSLYEKHLGYSAINSARSMLSTFVTIEGANAGKHPLVCRYIKGVQNQRPSLPKYNYTWDTGTVINYFRKQQPSDDIIIASEKLATLLAILSGQRGREILYLIDVRNITQEEHFMIVRIADPLKTSTIKYHNGEIRLPKFHEKTVCPVEALKEYLEKTKERRGDINSLFITCSKPYRKASKDTLARWIKNSLRKAGIDTSIFAPHSTRSASTSKARSSSVSIGTILKTGGWRSERTWAKHYSRVITYDEEFASTILKN